MDDFVHIPKASGSSLRTVLARQYGVSHIAYYEPGNPQLNHSIKSLREKIYTRNIGLITGHHVFGLHRDLLTGVRYFSIIRDPISRAASDYFFAYSYEHHRLRDEILSGSLTPEAFLIDGRQAGQFDMQCRMLSGRGDARLDHTELALKTVERCFVVVGVAELFAESLLYIAKRLGWKPPLYAVRNITFLPSEIEVMRRRVEDRVRADFADRYAADIKHHERVTAKLRGDIQAEGAPFTHALEAFLEMQAVIGRSDEASKYDRYEFAATDQLPDLASGLIGSEPYRVLEDYLNSEDVQTQQPHNYVGQVDVIADRTVGGWAADLFRNEPIEVRVYHLGRQIGSAVARSERPDVSAYGLRSNVGFKFQVNDEITNNKDVRVCFEDTSLEI